MIRRNYQFDSDYSLENTLMMRHLPQLIHLERTKFRKQHEVVDTRIRNTTLHTLVSTMTRSDNVIQAP